MLLISVTLIHLFFKKLIIQPEEQKLIKDKMGIVMEIMKKFKKQERFWMLSSFIPFNLWFF